MPPRNLGLTGREGLLGAVRASMLGGYRGAVQALHGMGGVGKTQVAIEYAHRYADEYSLIWWLNAETPPLLGEQFRPLAVRLGCAEQDTPPDVVRRELLMTLHDRDRWLVIFDNAERPDDIAAWLPGGPGHVIITSRWHGWAELAVPVEVTVLARAESVALLRERVAALSVTDAEKIASALGDLPLAVAQAASYIADTAMPAARYVDLLQHRAAELLGEGKPSSYPSTLAAVTQLAYDQLRAQEEAAADLAAICAFLAPDLIPVDWFTIAADRLSLPLAERLRDPLGCFQLVTRVTRSVLAQPSEGGLIMHRLTQAILRSLLPPAKTAVIRGLAEAVIAANHPGTPDGTDDHSAVTVYDFDYDAGTRGPQGPDLFELGDLPWGAGEDDVRGSDLLVLDGRWILYGRLPGADNTSGGIVWRARDRLNDSWCVVKTVPSGTVDWDTANGIQLLGLRNEQRIAGISSDHIGEVIAHGEDRGFSYLVYPLYLPGSLGLYCRQRSPRPSPRWCAKVIYQVLSGLMAAAAVGLVHLDVKPGNIVLDGQRARVIDWGLSRKRDASQPSTWIIQGSPFYAAPEILQWPPAAGYTPLPSLYGVGATFYWLITGEAPLARQTCGGYALSTYRELVLSGTRPQPVHEVVTGVPPALGALIDRWLSYDPELRVPPGTPMEDTLRVAREELAALLPMLPE